MASQQIAPLRIQKGNGTPRKMPTATSRTLSELSPMAIRRNSPSFPQMKHHLNEGSPVAPAAGSSPFSNGTDSPKLFWQRRDMVSPARENQSPDDQPPISCAKRSSIENLKKASRVKNSGIFALEQEKNYDPSRPVILDGKPRASGSVHPTSGHRSSDLLRKENVAPVALSSASPASSPYQDAQSSPAKEESADPSPLTALVPSKKAASPKKSSLSKRSGANFRNSTFDPDTSIWTDDQDDDGGDKTLPPGKGLHSHSKSVTFDHGPPQINEYEMVTPDPSSVASGSREGSYDSFGDDDDDDEFSSERGMSADIDDSFDATLEDTDKTPVVMPEDWRFMSPEAANTRLTQRDEDVFDDEYGSPAPDANPSVTTDTSRPLQTSLNSVDSNGQARPLPPLPAPRQSSHQRSPNRDSLSGTFERMSGLSRHHHSPSVVINISKSDIVRMSHTSMSIEDRLRILMDSQDKKESLSARTEANSGLEREASKEPSSARASQEPEQLAFGEPGPEVDEQEERDLTHDESHISHDSILRHMRSDANLRTSADSERSSYISCAAYDPDVPIPSLEDPTVNGEALVKEEPEEVDLYSIADVYHRPSDLESNASDDVNSQYSQQSQPAVSDVDAEPSSESDHNTPRALSPAAFHHSEKSLTKDSLSLPDFADFEHNDRSFNTGLESYLATERESEKPTSSTSRLDSVHLPDLAALRDSIQRPFTPQEQLQAPGSAWVDKESGTPESVIRHPMTREASLSPPPQVPPKDETEVSAADDAVQDVEHRMQNMALECTPEEQEDQQEDQPDPTNQAQAVPDPTTKRVSSLVQLEIPVADNEDLSFGLEKEFDRVVEVQKRGYLMRQNTKVVVATERESHDEPRACNDGSVAATDDDHPDATSLEPNKVVSSPRNMSQPTWVAEPWNGKSRRKSIRVGGEKIVTKRKPVDGGAVPPLPGQPSNAHVGLDSVAESELGEEEAEEFEDGVERGRLFVKVIGAKDLDIPLPKNESAQFALTLDNGLHCVTTSWLDLATTAPIGQEFELVVLNDLEFQLTLQMKLEEPPVQRAPSPTKMPGSASPTKQNVFGRLFGSPKKKKESSSSMHQSSHSVSNVLAPPSAYELVQGLVAKDGSFARAYVTLSEHEQKAYGRPYSVDITCFNEWAMEEVHAGSSRSKKSVTQLRKRPPYAIGKLELLLLYIPKPKGAKDEDMPKSMNSAVRALREAEERLQQQAQIKEFEGNLSQQGGDCPYWRRRYFKLAGTKLTAYHEITHQPRATINLAKATKLIDDKSTLTQKETTTKGGGRRKSAFAEEEEGYMFIEEGFRIRFANGEVIDFYADSAAEKDEWMKALGQVVGKNIASGSSASGQTKPWVDMVLKREKSMQLKQQKKSFRPAVPDRQSSREHAQLPQPLLSHPPQPQAQPKPSTQSSPLKHEHPRVGNSGIPLPTRSAEQQRQQQQQQQQQQQNSRPGAGHMRSESYHPNVAAGSRSQAGSPVKQRISPTDRARKVRSMLI